VMKDCSYSVIVFIVFYHSRIFLLVRLTLMITGVNSYFFIANLLFFVLSVKHNTVCQMLVRVKMLH